MDPKERTLLEQIATEVADWCDHDVKEIPTQDLLQTILSKVKDRGASVMTLYTRSLQCRRLQEAVIQAATILNVSMDDEGVQVLDLTPARIEFQARLDELTVFCSSWILDGHFLICYERVRQATVKDWTSEHDATHINGELRDAAIAYLMVCDENGAGEDTARAVWPWESDQFKPHDSGSGVDLMRCLEKAGALVAAELDRLNRLTKKEGA